MASSSPENSAKIWLRVHPNATRNEVVDFADGVWRLKIAAPPVKGQANKELITFLSQALGVGKGALAIIKGHTSRSKLVNIEGLSQKEIRKRLLP